MPIFLKTEDEIDLMRKANRLVGAALAEVGKHIKPGVTTLQLDAIAEEFIRDHGAEPAFKNFPNPFGEPFPGSICTSVNEVVAHGIPSPKAVLREGDIISVDCAVLLHGYNGDSCYTFCVGNVTEEVRSLLRVTKQCLYAGIDQAFAGNHLGDIGNAIQSRCETHGFGVVHELTGHGIGQTVHESPAVPNYGKKGCGDLLKSGMCIAIEPMVTMGNRHIGVLPDGWGMATLDGSLSAHFEHTVAICAGKAEVLSTFKEIEQQEREKY